VAIAQTLIEAVGYTHKCPGTIIKTAINAVLKIMPRTVAGVFAMWKLDQTISSRFSANNNLPYRRNWTVMKAFKKKTKSISKG